MSSEAQEAKEKGNQAFVRGDHEEAIRWFSEAIAYDGKNHILFSNRSAAYAAMGKYEEALYDADKTISLNPTWPKGYGRKGFALHYLGRYDEAMETYKKGLEFDPTSEQFKNGIAEAQEAKAARKQSHGGAQNPFAAAFAGDIWAKLDKDPRTASYHSDPETVKIIESVKEDPSLMQMYLGDEKVMNALAVLLNIPAKGAQAPPPPKPAQPQPQQSQPQPQSAAAKPAESDIPSEKQAAEAEKELGNKEYKQRHYEAAIAHYTKAMELYPDDIVYRSNRAAVCLEMGNYDECLKDCEQALEDAKRLKVYSMNGKLLARMGNAYSKMEKWAEAISCYNKSLTEHRTADTLQRLQKAEKAKKEADEKAYFNPEISLQEKAKGNEAFSKQDFPEAIKCYSEAIKRNPKDHILYSNRSTAYLKLGEFPYALKDAETCIQMCPTFVKGYTRKAACHFFMKEYHKAMTAYSDGLKIDPNNSECLEGLQKVESAVMASQGKDKPDEEQLKHAMADPEIQSILTDPIMRQVLQDMQSDRQAAQRHLGNPEIAAKINKLVAAGVLRVG